VKANEYLNKKFNLEEGLFSGNKSEEAMLAKAMLKIIKEKAAKQNLDWKKVVDNLR